MVDFSGAAGARTATDLIPAGQLAFAILSYRGHKDSTSPNKDGKFGRYLDIELVIDDGQPFARKKIWTKIGDPMHADNTEAYRQMGQVALARICESSRGAGPSNPAGYVLPGDAPAAYAALDGLRVAIKIKIEKGRDGYDDKNDVAEFLTPNPTSGGNKGWLKLQAGQFNMTAGAAQPPVQSSFGMPAGTRTAAPGPTLGSGFQPTAPAQATSAATTSPAAPSATPAAPSTTQPGAAPAAAIQPNGWLTQAQQPA